MDEEARKTEVSRTTQRNSKINTEGAGGNGRNEIYITINPSRNTQQYTHPDGGRWRQQRKWKGKKDTEENDGFCILLGLCNNNWRNIGIFTIYVEHRRRRGEYVEQRRRHCVRQFLAAKAVHSFTSDLLTLQNKTY